MLRLPRCVVFYWWWSSTNLQRTHWTLLSAQSAWTCLWPEPDQWWRSAECDTQICIGKNIIWSDDAGYWGVSSFTEGKVVVTANWFWGLRKMIIQIGSHASEAMQILYMYVLVHSLVHNQLTDQDFEICWHPCSPESIWNLVQYGGSPAQHCMDDTIEWSLKYHHDHKRYLSL